MESAATTARGRAPATGASGRFWQLDGLRGLFVGLMIFYHLMWDLSFFGLYPGSVTQGAWLLFARSIATVFLFLVGLSIHLAAHRHAGAEARRRWRARGLKLLGWGMVITGVTAVFLGSQLVIFGILHLIGFSMLLAPWLLPRARSLLVPALAVLIGGQAIIRIPAAGPWLIPLGIQPPGYTSVDYFPIFPWFGVVLLGLYLGWRWFPEGRPRLTLTPAPPAAAGPLCFMGRHALVLYLVHQPVLLGILALLGYGIG